jgi:hypothetical protein
MDFFELFSFTNRWIMDNLPPLPVNYTNESFYTNYYNSYPNYGSHFYQNDSNYYYDLDTPQVDTEIQIHSEMDGDYESEYNSESDFEQ